MNNGKRTPAASPEPPAARAHRLMRHPPVPVPALRVALERKISLRFPHVRGFLTEYSSNISISGMFIRSSDPRTPGTVLEFELVLLDGLKLIRGTGEVVWVRKKDDGTGRPAGMGVRFLSLDPESRRLIHWVVEKHIFGGAEPFDLDDRPAAADDEDDDV